MRVAVIFKPVPNDEWPNTVWKNFAQKLNNCIKWLNGTSVSFSTKFDPLIDVFLVPFNYV